MKCKRKSCHNEAIKDSACGILPCKSCQAKDSEEFDVHRYEYASVSRLHRIQQARDEGAKDIIQPFDGKGEPNPDFARAYVEKSKDYFSDEQLKRI